MQDTKWKNPWNCWVLLGSGFRFHTCIWKRKPDLHQARVCVLPCTDKNSRACIHEVLDWLARLSQMCMAKFLSLFAFLIKRTKRELLSLEWTNRERQNSVADEGLNPPYTFWRLWWPAVWVEIWCKNWLRVVACSDFTSSLGTGVMYLHSTPNVKFLVAVDNDTELPASHAKSITSPSPCSPAGGCQIYQRCEQWWSTSGLQSVMRLSMCWHSRRLAAFIFHQNIQYATRCSFHWFETILHAEGVNLVRSRRAGKI